MASNFTLKIVTPDRKFFEGEVEMIIARGIEGDMGILKNHTPFVTPLGIGKIKIKQNGKTKEAAIASGYMEVTKEKTTIVADSAEWPEEIDIERAKKAEERARKRLEKKEDTIDMLRVEIALKKAINRINVSGK